MKSTSKPAKVIVAFTGVGKSNVLSQTVGRITRTHGKVKAVIGNPPYQSK